MRKEKRNPNQQIQNVVIIIREEPDRLYQHLSFLFPIKFEQFVYVQKRQQHKEELLHALDQTEKNEKMKKKRKEKKRK